MDYYGQYTLGRVVKHRTTTTDEANNPILGGWLGHITGFNMTRFTTCSEIILKVKWCDGTENSIHPGNVELI